mgnify:CR=1 FL=1
MALNIELMRQKLNNSQNKNTGKSGDTKWRPSEGDQTIRILPTKDGDPFKEFHFHYNVGKRPGILCPKKNYGEHCPICDFASSLWRDGVENNEFKNVDPRITALSILVNIEGIHWFTLFDKSGVEAHEYINTISNFILNGLKKKSEE